MDEKLMRQAEERANAKRGFRRNAIMYVGVNFCLVVIYFLTGRGKFWPIWCIAGWGFGLFVHGLRVCEKLPGKTLEEEIQIEYRRLKSKVNANEEHSTNN